jgi:membrane fusion protein (multidrug efflux system)
LSKFAAGNAASIEVASMPDKGFTATIARISPTINTRNGTFRATALISNAEGNLAPGMFGHFTIAYEQHTDALVIPAEALIDEDDENTVYVVVRRNVEVGIAADGNIEILDGLNEDDVVVVVGHSGLRNGSKVLASNTTPDSFTG